MNQFYIQKMVIYHKKNQLIRNISIFGGDNFFQGINYQIIARSNTAKKPEKSLAFFFCRLLAKTLFSNGSVQFIAYYGKRSERHHLLPVFPIICPHPPSVPRSRPWYHLEYAQNQPPTIQILSLPILFEVNRRR